VKPPVAGDDAWSSLDAYVWDKYYIQGDRTGAVTYQPQPSLCRDACGQDPRCNYWSWFSGSNGYCELYTGQAGTGDSKGVVSGTSMSLWCLLHAFSMAVRPLWNLMSKGCEVAPECLKGC
jgi:hypothetical protein